MFEVLTVQDVTVQDVTVQDVTVQDVTVQDVIMQDLLNDLKTLADVLTLLIAISAIGALL